MLFSLNKQKISRKRGIFKLLKYHKFAEQLTTRYTRIAESVEAEPIRYLIMIEHDPV